MGLYFKTIALHNNQTKVVEFDDNVQTYIAGLNSFQLQYKGSAHHVHTAGVVIQAEKTDQRSIAVTARLTLVDDSHNVAHDSYTFTYVTVLAWCGEDSGPALLKDVPSIPSTVTSPTGQFVNSGAIINSFKMTLDGDHTLTNISANVSAHTGIDDINISGEAAMGNESHDASQASLSAGLIAALQESPGYEIRLVNLATGMHGKDNTTKEIEFNKDVKEAVAILSSFDLAFLNDDYSIRSIRAGATKYDSSSDTWSGNKAISIDPENRKKVTVTANATLLKDDGKESEQNELTFLVIALVD